MTRHLMTALGATLVFGAVAGVGIASAQTTSAATTTATTTSTTVAQTTQQSPSEAPKPKKRAPMVVVHIDPVALYNVGGADLPRPSYECAAGTCGPTGNYEFADPATNLGYGININIAPKWALNYSHGYVNQNLGTVTNAEGKTTYQVFNNDRTDDASLSYAGFKGFTVAFGWHQRVRQCCGNPPKQEDAGQTAEHWEYLNVGSRFGPGSGHFGKLFGLSLEGEYIPHDHPSCAAGSTVCLSGTSKFHVTYTGNITLPVGNPRTSTFAVFATYLNNFDYFQNSPVQYLYNEADYGIKKQFSKYVTLTVTNSNLYQHEQGYPFIVPNTINRDKLFGVLDIALPVF